MNAILGLFVNGGLVMWPLLATSIFSLSIIIERAWLYLSCRERMDQLLSVLEPSIRAQLSQPRPPNWDTNKPLGRIAGIYVQQWNQPREIRDDVLRREGLLILGVLDARVRWLAIAAQVATLLGLFGTFYFMICRFHPSAIAEGGASQAQFYLAIWESFLSTMFGLGIAIPSTVAFQLFESRVERIARDMTVLVSYLDEWSRAPLPSEEPLAPPKVPLRRQPA